MHGLMKCGGVRKHLVIKIDDFVKYVNNGFKAAMLQNDLEDIQAGRKADGKDPCPEYIVINTDETYVSEIIEILKRHHAWGPNEMEK